MCTVIIESYLKGKHHLFTFTKFTTLLLYYSYSLLWSSDLHQWLWFKHIHWPNIEASQNWDTQMTLLATLQTQMPLMRLCVNIIDNWVYGFTKVNVFQFYQNYFIDMKTYQNYFINIFYGSENQSCFGLGNLFTELAVVFCLHLVSLQ